MEDTLVDMLSATEPADLAQLVRQLCREVLELRQEVADLRRENLELRQQVGYWKAQHARAVHRAEHLEAEVENLRGENRKLQDQLFGRKSEKSSTRDRSNHLEGESDERDSSTPRKRGQRKDRPGPQRRDYSHLPVVEDLRELPEDQRACPQCGAALSPSNTEDSEQIEIEVEPIARRIRRRYQRTCTCPNCPRTVTALASLIPKGVLGVSIWVEILLDKSSPLPATERLLGQWHGAGTCRGPGGHRGWPWRPGTPRTTLSAGITGMLKQDTARRSHRPMKLAGWSIITLEGKTGYRWWLWVFLGDDTVVFRLDPTRSTTSTHEPLPGRRPWC